MGRTAAHRHPHQRQIGGRGNLNAFTNPHIEAGLVHCRALLEFLGLCMINARLGNVRKRRISDIGIEHFSNANGPLPMVTPEEAVSRYDGGREEAEEALISIFQAANKDLAHITTDLVDNPKQAHVV